MGCYQISKQADVLMLRYLRPSDELRDLLIGLGYHVTAEQLAQTVYYYLASLSARQDGRDDLKFRLAYNTAYYGADPDLMAAAARLSAADHLS